MQRARGSVAGRSARLTRPANRRRPVEPMRLQIRQTEHISGNQAARRPQRVVAVTEIPRSLMGAENETMAGEHQDEANGSHHRRPLWGHQPHTRRPEHPRRNSQEDRQTVDPDPRTVGEMPPARLELAAADRRRVRLVPERLSSLAPRSPLSLRLRLSVNPPLPEAHLRRVRTSWNGPGPRRQLGGDKFGLPAPRHAG